MANFFSLQNGSLTNTSIYGYSLTGAEIMNNTTGTMLLTSGGNIYSSNGFSDGSTISAVAVHLSARSANPTGTLGLTLRTIASAGTFIDSSSNNFSITPAASAYQSTFSPFSPNGWSGYFNGTTDYLKLDNVASLNMGSGDFTIEFFINKFTAANAPILDWRTTTVQVPGALYIDPSNRPLWLDGAGSSKVSSLPVVAGVWTHVAVVKRSSVLTMYVNGISGYSGADTVTYNPTGSWYIGGTPNIPLYNNCYLSNFRILKGTALYTSTFTPSTSPLTNIANTSLLTLQNNQFRDNSNNNLTLTAVGSVAVKDTSPFTPVTINPAVHGGSGLFKNSPIYLPSSSTSSLSFGTGDFTVEFWIYPMANLNLYEAVCDGSAANSFSIQTQNATNNILHVTTGGAIPNLAPNRPLILNQWNHFAATRSSGSLMLYVNGLSSAQVIGNTTNFTEFTIIGGQRIAAHHLKNSYLSNFRVIKGRALYTTATITPSTSPLTNISGTSLLLNTNNYGFRSSITETYAISSFTSFDGSNNLLTQNPQNWQILELTNPLSTNYNDVINYTLSTSSPNQLSLIGRNSISATDITGINLITSTSHPSMTSFSPFITNENSFVFNGTYNCYLLSEKSELVFGIQDFTIEGWIYPTIIVGPRLIYSTRTGADGNTNVFSIYIENTGKLQLYSGSLVLGTGTQTVSANTWQHVAFTRYNGTGRVYLNGVMSCSGTLARDFNVGKVGIGSGNTGAEQFFAGAISNLRVVNGTAVYTTSSFTPPTTPLTIIPNTVFLLKNGARYDQALISNEILKTGKLILNGTQLSSANPFGSGLDSSIRFNGGTDNIKIPYSNISFGSDFSLECWFYWNREPSGVSTDQNHLFSNISIGLQMYLSFGGNWGISNGSAGVSFGTSPTRNVWHHFYLNRSNGILRVFLDGTQVVNVANTTSYPMNTLAIGGYPDNSGSFGFSGFMSNVRISIRPLYIPINNTITVPTGPVNITDINNTITINTNSYNLSSFYSTVQLNDIHIGGGLKSLNTESITVTANTLTLDNLYIHNQGTLTFPLTSSTTLNLSGSAGLQITSDGTLNIGTSSVFIPLSTTHVINLSNTQIDVHNGGNFNVYGFPETTTTSLVSTHAIGSRVFTVTNTVSNNWRVGDILSFKPNLSARRSFDELILSSFLAPNVFTTTSSSLCTHTGSADQFGFIPDVYNLTRNVTIQGSSAIARGTIRTVDAAKTNVNYAQLSNFGINSLNKTGFVLGNNSSGNTVLSGIVINSDNTTTVNNIAPLTGRIFQNVTINNSIINRSNTITVSSLSVNNINVSNNYILSSGGTALNLTNLSGSINMSNTNIIGSLSVGTNLVNTSLTGTYGALNYNSGLQGMMISGSNTGAIIGGSINSAREGVYVDASTSNLSSLSFQNIIANNNTSVGFKVSGNNLNYLTPVILNITGLTANTNLNAGFEGYNITGNLSSIVVNNNLNEGIKTSIGNGNTTFDGLTSILSSIPVNILSGYNYNPLIIRNTLLSSNSSVGIRLDSTRFSKFSLENSIISASTPIQLNITRNLIEGTYLFNNTFLGSINFIDLTKYQPNAIRTVGFGFTNYNKIAGNHFTYLPMGVKAVDTLLYDSSTSDLISERLTPTSKTIKLCSGTKYVALNSAEDTLVKVNILVSSSYTGNPPRLMVRRNPAAGIYSDTVLSVYTPAMGYDIFTQLTGAKTLPVIDNAVLEFYIDCDGTTGYVCVDTWTAN